MYCHVRVGSGPLFRIRPKTTDPVLFSDSAKTYGSDWISFRNQGSGAGVFGWSRSRHFRPAPALASILAGLIHENCINCTMHNLF